MARTPLTPKWRLARSGALPAQSGPWRNLIATARTLDRDDRIDRINRWVNAHVRFADDRTRFHVADRWATVNETLTTGQGDCEDYAIAKMKLLEAAGLSPHDLYLVIANDLVRRADHAVLVVRNDNGRLVVLDNGTDEIVDATAAQDYRPVMSFSTTREWIHGYAGP